MTAHFPVIEAAAVPGARTIGSIDSLARDAAGMLDRPFQRGHYDRIDWFALTARHLWPDTPIAIASARVGPHAMWLPLRDIGAGRARSLASWYTLAFAPIATPGCPQDARTTLLAAIVGEVARRFGALTLWPLEPDVSAELQTAFRAKGWIAIERVEAAHWVAHTAGLDFNTYWARRGSKLRNTVRRRAKSSPVEVMIFDGFDAEAWAAYETVYAGSWKPNEGSPAFVRAFAEQEGAAGTLRLGIALRDGQPVAAQFWTVENGVATIHKLAHLERERGNSPGTLLSHAMFRHVLDHDRPDLIDYGNGDEGYKAEWMDERRVRTRLRLFNPYSPSGLIAGAATAAQALLRRLRR
ncbi:MAG: GNAT family N-acetyltransferase [Sphingomonas sp.]